MITKRRLLCGMLSCAFSPIAAVESHAQGYPQRTIKIVVPGGAGGPGDLLVRIVAQHLQACLKQNVVVENNAVGGGLSAARAFARADPDGYTLFSGNTSTLAIIPAVSKNPGYDPAKDFAPVAKVADTFQVLVVEHASPLKSVQDLIANARANPSQINYGAIYGTLPHLAGELFKLRAGVDVVHVPYKTENDTNMAILAKQIQFSFPNVATALPLVREGTLRALAVTSATRRPELPDVPTLVECGLNDYVVTSFFGVAARAGTPAPIVDLLNSTINQALTTTEMRTALARFGAAAATGTPEEFTAFIAAERQKWTSVASSAGIRAD
jgi:tripartite-type tricarboxylate transporter receptor subunit TctC